MFDTLAKLRPRLESRCWLQPGQGQPLDQAIEQAKRVGNTVLEVDPDNGRFLVAKASKDVWGCRFCFETGELVLFDTETELEVHATEVHGWKK
jgi:hypothetical protein